MGLNTEYNSLEGPTNHSKKREMANRGNGNNKWSSVWYILLIISIPMFLNWLLQIPSPLKNVIGDDNAPREWLMFWGSYLAAVGSGSAAIIALLNERKNRERDYYQHLIESMEVNYYRLENEVKELCDLHSLFRITSIIRAFSSDGVEDAFEKKALWFSELEKAVICGERYFDQDVDKSFIFSLRKINSYYLNVCDELSLILNSALGKDEKGQIGKELIELLRRVANDKTRSELTNSFTEEARILLHGQREKIIRLHKRLQSISLFDKPIT